MNNIEELTKELCEVLENVKDDREYVAQASEIANIAGKIIKAQKIQLEYRNMRNEKPEIPFLE